MSPVRSDRRKTVRHGCKIRARFFIESRPAVACVIEDITLAGARIFAGEQIRAATRMLILIPSVGELWPAEVCWRREDAFGIRFMRSQADALDTEDAPSGALFAMQLQVDQMTGAAERLSQQMRSAALCRS